MPRLSRPAGHGRVRHHVAHRPRQALGIRQRRRHRRGREEHRLGAFGMDDAALIAVEAGRSRDEAADGGPDDLALAIDDGRHVRPVGLRREEAGAVLTCFGFVPARDEHGGAQDLRVGRGTERERRVARRESARRSGIERRGVGTDLPRRSVCGGGDLRDNRRQRRGNRDNARGQKAPQDDGERRNGAGMGDAHRRMIRGRRDPQVDAQTHRPRRGRTATSRTRCPATMRSHVPHISPRPRDHGPPGRLLVGRRCRTGLPRRP